MNGLPLPPTTGPLIMADGPVAGRACTDDLGAFTRAVTELVTADVPVGRDVARGEVEHATTARPGTAIAQSRDHRARCR